MTVAWILMAKAPIPGTVKTRLGEALGDAAAAAALQDAFLADLLRRPWSAGPRILAWAGDPEHPRARDARQHGWVLQAQQGDDLGARMAHAFSSTHQHVGNALMTGSDIVDLPADTMRWAARQTDAGRIALVPALDGGYVALGWPKTQPLVFSDVRWSSATTLSDHCRQLRHHGLPHVLGRPWADVDTVADLRRLAVHCRRQKSRAGRKRSVHVRAWLDRHACLLLAPGVDAKR